MLRLGLGLNKIYGVQVGEGRAGGASFVGAYDAIPNLVHVWEPARRTLSSWTGDLCEIERVNDGVIQAFGYVSDTDPELNKAAIATFLGASAGRYYKIKDQKGGDDLLMATAVRRPAYTANAQNGHAGGTWDGSATYQQSDALQCTFTNGGVIAQPFSVYVVAQLNAAKVNNGKFVTLFDGDNGTNRVYFYQNPIATPDEWQMYAGINIVDSATDSTFYLWAMKFAGAQSSFHGNNLSKASGNAGSASLDGLTLGSDFTLSEDGSWRGPIVSCVIATSHSDADRLALQEAINSYWNLYAPFELPAGEPDLMIAVMPDTQYFTTDDSLYIFQAMTQWIADNRANIDLAVHVGDIVYTAWSPSKWSNADIALGTIEDISDLPVLYCAGNHDYEENPNSTIPVGRPLAQFNNRFSPAHYEAKSWWNGGFYEAGHGENFYFLITLGGRDYIFLNLEFGPRQAVIDWANTVLTTYAARDAIVLTHCYLYRDSTRFTTGDPYNPHVVHLDPDTNDAEEMWTELIKLHSNIVQVWSGHDRGIASQVSTGDGGNIVTEYMNGHDVAILDGNLTLVRYYLSQNKVAYTRYTPLTNKVDWQVVKDYKAS